MKRGEGFRYMENADYPIAFFPFENIIFKEPIIEEFRDITTSMVEDVYPWYMISNYGRIWHKYLGSFLNINIDSKGYSYKPLASLFGPRVVRIHRLVLSAFNPIENYESFLVNHIDGNKINNFIGNLEWTTYSGNAIHAYEHGLVSRTHKCTYDDPELIHAICADIQNNVPMPTIAALYSVPKDVVEDIKYKKSHKEISDLYSFDVKKYRKSLTEEQVRRICLFYSTNKRDKNNIKKFYIDALKSININPTPNAIITAQRIYTRKLYTAISAEYFW